MFKDVGLYALGSSMAPMYWAHHLLCWTIIISFFYNDTVGVFIFGATCMEFGGAAQTLHLLSEDSALTDAAHVGVMTASNLAACGTSLVFASVPAASLPQRALITLCVFVLSWQRQTYAMSVHRAHADRRRKRA